MGQRLLTWLPLLKVSVRRSSRILADDHPSLAAEPDVIVADISMPGTDGLTAMKQIYQYLPPELVYGIRTVLDGGTYASSAIAV